MSESGRSEENTNTFMCMKGQTTQQTMLYAGTAVYNFGRLEREKLRTYDDTFCDDWV